MDFQPLLNTLCPRVNDDTFESQGMFSCFGKSEFYSRALLLNGYFNDGMLILILDFIITSSLSLQQPS